MFDNEDNQGQQTTQDDGAVMQAAMPDPISFGAPQPPTTVADSPTIPDFNIPELPPTSTSAYPTTSSDNTPAVPSNIDDLAILKQQALQQLSPLVSHLDQTPEEKFRTTMMMIQASDDQTLIKSAFEAAQTITDDKARAQALLDVINEINYFTQRQG